MANAKSFCAIYLYISISEWTLYSYQLARLAKCIITNLWLKLSTLKWSVLKYAIAIKRKALILELSCSSVGLGSSVITTAAVDWELPLAAGAVKQEKKKSIDVETLVFFLNVIFPIVLLCNNLCIILVSVLSVQGAQRFQL